MLPVNQHDNSEIRTVLLAEIAEQYFVEGKTQAQIARGIGVDRSMISRWLAEARKMGIVDIRVNWPVVVDNQLELKLVETFGLQRASVVVEQPNRPDGMLGNLGKACSWLLKDYLTPTTTIAIGMGSAIREVIDELDTRTRPIAGVVQLTGSLGSHSRPMDGHDLVLRAVEKLGGDTYFLNAPFILDTIDLAQALRRNRSVEETLLKARECDVALVGIGTTSQEREIYYEAGYMLEGDMEYLLSEGVVGEICGLHFTVDGTTTAAEYEKRLITVDRATLLGIPDRIGIAGGNRKIDAILGALRSGLVNILVTDYLVAEELLRICG